MEQLAPFLYYLVVFFCGILLATVPRRFWMWMIPIFGMDTFGLHEIKRRNDVVDWLGNGMLFVSILFCLFYWVFPFYWLVYSLLFWIGALCLVAQAVRISSNRSWLALAMPLFWMIGFAFVGGLGISNQFTAGLDRPEFVHALVSGDLFNLFYILHHRSLVTIVAQGLLMAMSFYLIWAQFKYMRLESTFKAYNLFFFWVKVIILCAILIACSITFFELINWAYHVPVNPQV